MARLGAKHGQQTLTLADFSGGLNYLSTAEMIGQNELRRADNFEYDVVSGQFKTVDGMTKLYDTGGLAIDRLYYDQVHDTVLFIAGGKLYKSDLASHTLIGTLTGSKRANFAVFDTDILIASGGKLQKYDGSVLTTIDNSPNHCDMVFIRSGRVLISSAGQDNITYSSVGDCTTWADDSNRDDSGKWAEVGYKDGADIVAVCSLSQDIVIFKSNGTVYRLAGEYPSWVVYEVSRKVDCFNYLTALALNNDIVFLGADGFNALSTVQSYGNVKASEIGLKVNPVMIKAADRDKAMLWHIRSKGQVWIRADNSNELWIYNYALRCFTKRVTLEQVNDVAERGTEVLIAIGGKISRLDCNADTENGTPFTATLESKTFTSDNHYLIKKIELTTDNITDSRCFLSIGKLSMEARGKAKEDIAAADIDTAYLDRDKPGAGRMKTTFTRCNMRLKSCSFKLLVEKGAIGLCNIKAMVTEV